MKTKCLILSLSLIVFISLGFISDDFSSKGKLKKETLVWQGLTRNYLIYIPSKYDGSKPVPLLFHLHGGGGTAKGTIGLTHGKFNELADEKGFIVVYPNAVKKNWNDGRDIELKYELENIDDVGFITAVVGKLKNEYAIDSEKVFVTGMSNGGFMTSRLLCEKSDVFRGGAILTATISVDYIEKCHPENPLGVMIINGTDDPLVPYNGGDIKVFNKKRGKIIATDDYVNFWKNQMDCENSEVVKLSDLNIDDHSTVEVTTYKDCGEKALLVLYKIQGGGHTWPGGKQYLPKSLIGNTNRDFNACEVIWDFFENLPERHFK